MSDRNKPPQPSPGYVKQVWLGIGLLMLLHFLLFLYPMAFIFIGVVQLIYLIPALIVLRNKKGVFQGLLIGAGITFLLNAACFGLMLGSMFAIF